MKKAEKRKMIFQHNIFFWIIEQFKIFILNIETYSVIFYIFVKHYIKVFYIFMKKVFQIISRFINYSSKLFNHFVYWWVAIYFILCFILNIIFSHWKYIDYIWIGVIIILLIVTIVDTLENNESLY